MQFAEGNGVIPIRLEPGEEVHESLQQACRALAVHAGYFISGIGMLEDPELGFLVAPGEYDRHLFSGKHELLNLSGNVSLYKGELLTHLHVTLSGRDHKCFGGHLFSAKAAVTVELVLLRVGPPVALSREFEASSGLPGLYVHTTGDQAG